MLNRISLWSFLVLVIVQTCFVNTQLSSLEFNDGMAKEISLNFRNIDVIEALQYLANEGGFNIAFTKGVSGRVTLKADKVTIKDAFDIILLTSNLAYEKRGSIYNIMSDKEYQELYGKKFADVRKMKVLRLKYAIPEKAFGLLDVLKSDVGRVLVDEETGTIMVMDTPEKLEQMQEALSSIEERGVVEVFNLQYANAKEIEEHLKTQLSDKKVGSIKADERNNQIIVQTLPERMEEIRQLISSLDQKTKEVLIEAKVIRVSFADDSNIGLKWEFLFEQMTEHGLDFIGSHTYDTVYRTGQTTIANYPKIESEANLPSAAKESILGKVYFGSIGQDSFEALMTFLSTIIDAKLLASPRIAVVNNQEAKIHVGRKEVYLETTSTQSESTTTIVETPKWVDTGVLLSVTPKINDEGYITMNIKPEITSIAQWYISPTGRQYPVTEVSTAETKVMVKDGTTIIIGGLRRKEDVKTIEKVPFLGDIWVLGKLFRSEVTTQMQSELIVFITPYIISGEELIKTDDHEFREPTPSYREYDNE
ncbi:MAG: secretin N-terminal domain-containing protein [Candidatus Ratteibacteria bacterium]|nr:secretin N-terminal domain-containing protein [Candidatus Ratteibacteria bacterium]